MTVLLLVATATVLVSSMCSLFESVLYSTRSGALEAERVHGTHPLLAERFLAMKANIAKPTSAILILNTLANTAGATICGMYAAQLLEPRGVVLFSIVLTMAILFVGEILPKTYGAMHWQGTWWLLVWPITLLQKGFAPLIRVTQGFTHLFSGARGVPAITEEEIVANIRLGRVSGQLTESEHQLLNAVFRFDDLLIRQVMLPRTEVVFLDQEWSLARCLDVAKRTRHTRFPLCRGSLDDAIGVVHIKDLVGASTTDASTLSSIARPLQITPETRPISQVLRDMQRSQQHMELVYDEHGTVVGMVTMENIVEQLIGAVQDEFDSESADIEHETPGVFRVRGRVAIERLNRELKLNLQTEGPDTLSGLLVQRLKRLPAVGDAVELTGATAHVLAVGNGRATSVRVVTGPGEERHGA
ncbi:MAG: hemolysin family protein [Acidobacteria bacterium]|nr:hemolysin family protein [Acidobacteriota bacterium]